MRIYDIEEMKKLENSDSAFAYIVNTPRPDFTELERICEEIGAEMEIEHEKDRQIIAEALQNR